jgi:cholesterol oxidase
MGDDSSQQAFDYVVIGSGFGGSVAAMRLAEKGYRVLILERGKRFEDKDFARSNWNIRKFLWAPVIRCFGVQQISLLNGVMVLRWSGVGGGSLAYANVLEIPDDRLFAAPAWRHLADWKSVLMPHYHAAQRMLGVAQNPRLLEADASLKEIATELGRGDTFRRTNVGVFFGPEGQDVPDPYFGGEGPPRRGCNFCGACMVGCRYNGKNSLMKNYLYFAEKYGAEIRPEANVADIRPLADPQSDGARYEVIYHRSTGWLFRPPRRIRARNVVVSAGVLATLKLLFDCRDASRSLPGLSKRLGDMVRTNNESLTGVTSRSRKVDYSKGVAITSVFQADDVTHIEPVRYPNGSSLMKMITFPMAATDGSLPVTLVKLLGFALRHPLDFLRGYVLPGWAARTTILLVMQTEDNLMRLRHGRNLFTLFRRGLVAEHDADKTVPARLPIADEATRRLAAKTDGFAGVSTGAALLNIPLTAHILGGCPFGLDAAEGVVGLDCQAHNYPGLYVVDASTVPANPGINPSLTIAAMAEYAMSLIPPKKPGSTAATAARSGQN